MQLIVQWTCRCWGNHIYLHIQQKSRAHSDIFLYNNHTANQTIKMVLESHRRSSDETYVLSPIPAQATASSHFVRPPPYAPSTQPIASDPDTACQNAKKPMVSTKRPACVFMVLLVMYLPGFAIWLASPSLSSEAARSITFFPVLTPFAVASLYFTVAGISKCCSAPRKTTSETTAEPWARVNSRWKERER